MIHHKQTIIKSSPRQSILVTISVCAEPKDWDKGASETGLGSSSSLEECAVHIYFPINTTCCWKSQGGRSPCLRRDSLGGSHHLQEPPNLPSFHFHCLGIHSEFLKTKCQIMLSAYCVEPLTVSFLPKHLYIYPFPRVFSWGISQQA